MFPILALYASVAPGQVMAQETVERVFHLTSSTSERSVLEMATVIRSIAEIREVSTDAPNSAITFRGTPGQIAAAEWIFNELDRKPNTARLADQSVRQFSMEGAGDEALIGVFLISNSTTPQDFQEVAVVMRTIAEARRLFTYSPLNAIVVRGSSQQIAMMDWLRQTLDQAPASTIAHPHEFSMTGTPEFAVRVFFLNNPSTIQEFQEMATVVRSTAEIRRLFTYNRPKALVLRGTPQQIAMAEWLINTLDRPASAKPDGADRSYLLAGASDEIVRVFYLPHTMTIQNFQQTVRSVRSATSTRSVFTYNAPRAAIFRGTAEQVAAAERMFQAAQ